MIPNASGTLISTLKTSLANSSAGWMVIAVREAKGSRIGGITKTTGTPVGDAEYLRDVTLTSSTTVITEIELSARALVQAVGGAPGLDLKYISVWIDGAFSQGLIESAGGTFASSDSALDTTMRSLASTFIAARDTTLKDALAAGPQTGGGEYIDAATLAGIKTSLADIDAGWAVTSRNVVRYDREAQISVTLQAANIAMPPGTTLRAQLCYSVRLLGGQLVEANVAVRGGQWRTVDAALHTAIMALADAFADDQGDMLADVFAA